MFRQRCIQHVAAACAATFAILNGGAALATVLTFEMSANPGFVVGALESTYASYGDNVTATTGAGPGVTYNYGMGNGFTPNVTVDYSRSATPLGNGGHSLSGTQLGWSDPADYLHYLDTTKFWFTFTPDPLYVVDVNSFSIDLYNGGFTTFNWKLRTGSTIGAVFASGTELSMLASDPDRLVNISNGSFPGVVVLEIDFITGSAGNIGLDDLNFDQVLIPEPSSFALLGLGVIGMAIRARRRRAVA